MINYRPISLLMTMSKVLEKIVYSHMYSFLKLNDTLFDSQYSFRTKRSCEQAISELQGTLLQAQNNNLDSIGLFLDPSKAFDTLNHGKLLKKLESYGIHGLVNDWFKSYLNNRSLVAKIPTSENNITYLELFHINNGTAQGSCLGQLLFILFCDDIKLLPMYGKLILFASDTMVINCHKNRNFLRFFIIHDLQILMDWFKANQLSLNLSSKTMGTSG